MKTSRLWDSLAKEKFAKIDETFLSNFREPGNANNRLAAWDPLDKSMRYFKFLLFHQINSKDEVFFSNYQKIGPTNIGNPVSLKFSSKVEINLDHFFSIEEYTFLDANLNFDVIESVIEIGAGFGRTAQALIKLVNKIKKYTIVDIPEVLSLSQNYLRKVLEDHEFKKLVFVNAFELERSGYHKTHQDLVINIDSFQEMPSETIKQYFESLICESSYFYSKNAIGKYRPESIGLKSVTEQDLLDVFSLGLSTDVIDIFDQSQLIKARNNHMEQYRPSTNWSCIAQEPLGIFPYYLSLLYAKNR